LHQSPTEASPTTTSDARRKTTTTVEEEEQAERIRNWIKALQGAAVPPRPAVQGLEDAASATIVKQTEFLGRRTDAWARSPPGPLRAVLRWSVPLEP